MKTTITKATTTKSSGARAQAAETGFRLVPVDQDFALRSAEYLAAKGYRPAQIRSALVEQLDVSDSCVDDIISTVAA